MFLWRRLIAGNEAEKKNLEILRNVYWLQSKFSGLELDTLVENDPYTCYRLNPGVDAYDGWCIWWMIHPSYASFIICIIHLSYASYIICIIHHMHHPSYASYASYACIHHIHHSSYASIHPSYASSIHHMHHSSIICIIHLSYASSIHHIKTNSQHSVSFTTVINN